MVRSLFFVVIMLFTTAFHVVLPSEHCVIPDQIQKLIIKELAERSIEGYPAGTLVKTPTGYAPIETLKDGDCVVSYNQETRQQETSTITTVETTSLRDLMAMTFADGSKIFMAPQSLFYDYVQAKWMLVDDLDATLARLNNNLGLDVINVEYIVRDNPETLYLLLVEPHHNFFITKRDILVHNLVVSIPLTQLDIRRSVQDSRYYYQCNDDLGCSCNGFGSTCGYHPCTSCLVKRT